MVNQYYNIVINESSTLLQYVWSNNLITEILTGLIISFICFVIAGIWGYKKFLMRYLKNRKIRKEILNSLNLQVSNQLKKQKHTSKFIPDTFIEIENVKDKLRYFCDSLRFYKKVRMELGILDFKQLNVFLKNVNYEKYDFNFKIEAFKSLIINVKNFSKSITRTFNYLLNKKRQLENYEGTRTNNFYLNIRLFHDKLRRKIEEVEYLKARILIINESAGQGKTNLMCDLHANFLDKSKIPSVFLTGNDFRTDNINFDFIKYIFGIQDKYRIDELMKHIRVICKNRNKFFIVTIDGINENINYAKFPIELESFIEYLLKYDFVKIILTCRTEYFQSNFRNIQESSFKEYIIYIKKIPNELNENSKGKLFNSYLKHFHIQLTIKSEEVFNILTSDFLLLRIFTEAYANQNINDLRDIYREEIFSNYYSKKCDQINDRIKRNDEFKISGELNIQHFFERITKYMLDNKLYYNLPIIEFITDKNEEVFIRCIDEEVLLRRDLPNIGGSISSKEVINFTFDEFRDYLIADYLINKIYVVDKNKFQYFLSNDLDETTQIYEGVSKYLFYISKRMIKTEIVEMIKKCKWYPYVFLNCIFGMDDRYIDKSDLYFLQIHFMESVNNSSLIITKLMQRYDESYYKKLNLDYLMDYLEKLSVDEFNKLVYPIFNVSSYGDMYNYSKSNYHTWPIDKLVDNLKDVLNKDKIVGNIKLHKVFEFMIFLLPVSYSVMDLLNDYSVKYPNLIISKLLKRKKVKNIELKKCIEERIMNLNHDLSI